MGCRSWSPWGSTLCRHRGARLRRICMPAFAFVTNLTTERSFTERGWTEGVMQNTSDNAADCYSVISALVRFPQHDLATRLARGKGQNRQGGYAKNRPPAPSPQRPKESGGGRRPLALRACRGHAYDEAPSLTATARLAEPGVVPRRAVVKFQEGTQGLYR